MSSASRPTNWFWQIATFVSFLAATAYFLREQRAAHGDFTSLLRNAIPHTPALIAAGDFPIIWQAEAACERFGDWQDLDQPQYSDHRAVFCRQKNSKLRWPAKLPAGAYDFALAVWAYAEGDVNTVELRVGAGHHVWRWAPDGGAGLRTLTCRLTLAEDVPTVELDVQEIGQFAAVVDVLAASPVNETTTSPFCLACCCAATLALFLAAGCWGAFFWRHFCPTPICDPWTQWMFTFGLGLGFCAVCVTVVGILGAFRPLLVALFFGQGILLGGRPFTRTTFTFVKHWMAGTGAFRLASACLALIAALLAFASLTPAAGVDPQIYHLPIAKWLIRQGGFHYHRYQIAWAYPHNISNLFALCQIFWNDPFFRSAQFCQAVLGSLWLGSVYSLGKNLFGVRSGLFATVACLGVEGILFHFSACLADLGFALFATLATLALFFYFRESESESQHRLLRLVAVLCGFAASCKMQGPALAVVFAVTVFFWRLLQRQAQRAFQGFLTIGMLSLLLAAPMYLKNYWVWGNPQYPLTTWFANRDVPAEFIRALVASNAAWKYWPTGWAFWFWPIAWMGRRLADPFSPGPALVLVPFVFFLLKRRDWRVYGPLLVAVGLQAALWLLISPLTRFSLPWLAVLFCFAGACLEFAPRWLRWGMVGLLLIGVAPTALQEAPHFVERTLHIVRRSSNDAYLASLFRRQNGPLFDPPYRALRALNLEFTSDREPMLVDSNLLAYADFPTVPAFYYFKIRSFETDLYVGRPVSDVRDFYSTAYALRASPEVWRQELTERLGVRHILLSRARYPADSAHEFGSLPRMDTVLNRWVAEGIATRREFPNEVLYTLHPAPR